MTQAKYKTIPTLLKCLFIATPIGMLITKGGWLGDNSLVNVGVVWFLSLFVCLAITARTQPLKSLFIAVPGGIVLGFILLCLMFGASGPLPGNPFVVLGIAWPISTGIVWLVSLAIMRLLNRFARKSKHNNATVESTDEKSCPYCAETIKFAAAMCRYCRSSLDTPIQDKHVFGCILLAIFIACFYVSEAIGDTSIGSELSDITSAINTQSTQDYSSELSDIANAILSR